MASCARILITALLAGLLGGTLAAQERAFAVQVRDAVTGAPIPGVHVSMEGDKRVHATDADGRSVLTVRVGSALRFSHVSYQEQRLRVYRVDWEQQPHVVELVWRAVELPAVEVGRQAPEVVYDPGELQVERMVPTAEGLWVLSYKRRRMLQQQHLADRRTLLGLRLVLLDSNFAEVASGGLPAEAHDLHRDYAGRVYVEGSRVAWHARLEGRGIVLEEVGLEDLHSGILPWTDSIAGMLVGSDRVPTYPAFDHFLFDPAREAVRVLCSVEEPHTMELLRSEYKYMNGRQKVDAMNMARETGVDAEVIAAYMRGFHRTHWFRMPYAPLFRKGDSLYVFDHVQERLRHFDLLGNEGVPHVMRHAREKAWRERLLQDPATGRVYALFQQHGRAWLCEVSTGSGALVASHRLTFRYPEDVQVYDGHVYYVYRAYGSQEHRTLYRESLW
jgi:hypothetical protein